MEKEKSTLGLFFLLTYGISWLAWIPVVLSKNHFENLMILYVLGGFGPSIAAFILTYIYEGKRGIKNLLKRGFNFKIDKKWFLIIILLMPVIITLSLGLNLLLGGNIPPLDLLSNPILIISTFFIIFFFGGAVTEEFGWRGYALDRLKEKYNSLVSTLILGVVWGFWHLPLFFMIGTSQSNMPLSLFIINSVLLSILFSWLHNNNNGNIMVAILFHTMVNLSYSIAPLITSNTGFISILIVMVIVDGFIIFKYGPEDMIKKEDVDIDKNNSFI